MLQKYSKTSHQELELEWEENTDCSFDISFPDFLEALPDGWFLSGVTIFLREEAGDEGVLEVSELREEDRWTEM